MKNKVNYLKTEIIACVISIVLMFVYTFNYLDLIIYGLLVLFFGVLIGMLLLKDKEMKEYKHDSLKFLEIYFINYKLLKNSKKAFKCSSLLLPKNIHFTYETVIENNDLLNQLYMSVYEGLMKRSLLSSVDNKIISPVVEEISEEKIKYNENKVKCWEKYFIGVICLLFVFPLIRVFFGENLFDFNSTAFHITSIFTFISPYIYLCSILLIKDKRNEKNKF